MDWEIMARAFAMFSSRRCCVSLSTRAIVCGCGDTTLVDCGRARRCLNQLKVGFGAFMSRGASGTWGALCVYFFSKFEPLANSN